jgi:PhnB protein
MQSRPYIFFYGRCEEALEFYKKALGGSYELQRTKDFPMMVPPGGEFPGDRVMHSTFDAPGISFLASDGRETKAIDSEAGNISLAITTSDAAEGERVFKALSDGGTIKMPLEDAPWGEGKFGIFDDRFGIEWMVSVA